MRRCTHCGGQMIGQPYAEFFERGTRWTCILCAAEVEVVQHYTPERRRIDERLQRVSL